MIKLLAPTLLACATLLLTACAATDEKDRLLDEIRASTIVPQLGSYDEQEQRLAVTKVKKALRLAPEGTAEILATSLRDQLVEDRTKLMISWVLSEVRDERAIPFLLKHVGSTNAAVKDLVQNALSKYGTKTVPDLAELLQSGDEVARLNVTQILTKFKQREVFDLLWRQYQREQNGEIRFLLLCGFAEDPRKSCGERLQRALEDKDELVREHAWNVFKNRFNPPAGYKYFAADDPTDRNRQIAIIDGWWQSQ